MRVRVSYTVNVDDHYRRAVNLFYGECGLATRKQIRDHFWLYGQTADDDMRHTLDKTEGRDAD